MSLGARASQVRRMIVLEGATLLLIGFVLGALGPVLASRVLDGLRYGGGGQRAAHAWAVSTLDGRRRRDGGLGACRADLERVAGGGVQGGMRRSAVL